MENKNQTKKLPGFYIALCCCVIAIGVAGFIIQGENSQSVDTPTVVEETSLPELAFDADEAPYTDYGTAEDEPPTVSDAGTDVPEPIEDYAYDNPDVVSASVTVNAEESCSFADPIPDMTVLFGLSADALVYNEFYGDWRTHNGIDIAAEQGCSVSAAASGTVTDVGKKSYGNTVTIDHGNGFVSVYAQLGDVNVKEGDEIEQGAVIGIVGESTGENVTKPHLHYELIKDSKPVNPEEY